MATVSKLLRRLLIAFAVLAMALSGLVVLALVGLDSGPVPFALALVLALTPVPLYLAFILRLDRYEPEPVRTVVVVFAWGATVACLVALILNSVGQLIVGDALGTDAAELYGASISAPVVEEGAKGAVLFGLLRFHRHEVDGVLDGIVYAALVGLGFATTENVLYYSQGAVEDGIPGAIGTFVVRGVMSPFAHPLFTAATGIGIGLAVGSRRGGVRLLAPLIGLLVAMGLHSLWNTSAGAGQFFGVYVLIMLPLLGFVLAVALWQRRREGRIVTSRLPHFVEAGALLPGDVTALSTLRSRRRALKTAKRAGGRPAKRALADVQLAATELAFGRDRAARGIVRDEREAAQRETFWLERLRVRRADLAAALGR